MPLRLPPEHAVCNLRLDRRGDIAENVGHLVVQYGLGHLRRRGPVGIHIVVAFEIGQQLLAQQATQVRATLLCIENRIPNRVSHLLQRIHETAASLGLASPLDHRDIQIL